MDQWATGDFYCEYCDKDFHDVNTLVTRLARLWQCPGCGKQMENDK
jgi:ribosomal protein L37AE/L43A